MTFAQAEILYNPPPPTGPSYPVGLASTSGTSYFVDQFNQPIFLLGDAAWGLPGNAGRWNSGNWQSDFDTYVSNRSSKKYNIIYCKPMGTTQNLGVNDNGGTFDNLYPFQGGTPSTGVAGANPSTGLTSAYWARIDYLFNSAKSSGMTLFFNAIGYVSDWDSGPGPLAGKSSTEFQAYGTAIGTRYKNQPNLIYVLADDYFGDNDGLLNSFLTGLRGAGDTHLLTIENMANSNSRHTYDATAQTCTWGNTNAQFNFSYDYNATYFGIERSYTESSPLTVMLGDGYFYQGSSTYSSTMDRAMRQDCWWAVSSGARGAQQGSESIWQWQNTALASSGTDWWYNNNAGNIRTYVESLPHWYELTPDTSSALVTAGRGTHASALTSGSQTGQVEPGFTDTYVSASRSPDAGSGAHLAIIYMSHATTITINQAKMLSGYTATWVDPITCATSSATVGSTYNSTAKGNNSQGNPDWVLVLQG